MFLPTKVANSFLSRHGTARGSDPAGQDCSVSHFSFVLSKSLKASVEASRSVAVFLPAPPVGWMCRDGAELGPWAWEPRDAQAGQCSRPLRGHCPLQSCCSFLPAFFNPECMHLQFLLLNSFPSVCQIYRVLFVFVFSSTLLCSLHKVFQGFWPSYFRLKTPCPQPIYNQPLSI